MTFLPLSWRGAVVRPLLAAALLCTPLAARTGAAAHDLTDMAGRTVALPERIEHVYAMTHAFPLLAAVAPDLLAGFGFSTPPAAAALRLLPPEVAHLPALGGGSSLNLEALKAAGVDLAFGWTTPNEQYPVAQLGRIGVPVVFIDVDRLGQYPATLRFLGRLLGREARGEALARELETIIARLHAATQGLAAAARPRVYYAESLDGLSSQCDVDARAEVIALAGGDNALHCDNPGNRAQNHPIDIETLLQLDPDVIVTRFAATAAAIRNDPRWQRLRAVQAGRVHAVPALPFNWFDRPPSFMRALGALWLGGLLHPERFPTDLRDEVSHFETVFFGVTPGEADLDTLLRP